MTNKKTLLLMRHGKAARDEAKWVDYDRPLNSRGEDDSKRIGQWLYENQLVPDSICASASVRTEMTARCVARRVADAVGRQSTLVLKKELYHAPPKRYLTEIKQFSVAVDILLIVGHNPGLEELVERISGHFVTLPTAGLAHLTMPALDWNCIEDQELALVETIIPKSLA